MSPTTRSLADLAQLVLVDCLFTVVAMRSYDRSVSVLDAARSVLRTRHTERQDRLATPTRSTCGRADGLTVQV